MNKTMYNQLADVYGMKTTESGELDHVANSLDTLIEPTLCLFELHKRIHKDSVCKLPVCDNRIKFVQIDTWVVSNVFLYEFSNWELADKNGVFYSGTTTFMPIDVFNDLWDLALKRGHKLELLTPEVKQSIHGMRANGIKLIINELN